MKNWYYVEEGQQKGPLPEPELKALLAAGSLTANTLVWCEGMKDWLAASKVENFTAQTPPSLVSAGVSPCDFDAHAPGTCPLCGSDQHMAKAKPLYGIMICKKCYYSFANQRQAAYFLDLLVYYAICFVVGILMGVVAVFIRYPIEEIQRAASMVGWLLLPVMLFKDCFSGQSLGKILCGVKVIDDTTGAPGSLGASFKRNLPLFVPFMPLIVGFQLCKGHRMGDGWANTKVIWKKYANHPIFAPSRNQAKRG